MSEEKTAGKKMLLIAAFMAGATLLSKFLGLIRNSMIAAYFGTGMAADAYMTAQKLPTTLFDIVIGGVISASFIPVFTGLLDNRKREDAIEFANKFVTLIFVITSLISVFGIIFASPLISFMAPDYDAERHALAVQLTSIMFPMIIFTGFAFSFVGILQSFGEYNIPAIISLISNVAIIVYFLIFGKKFGVVGLAVTMLVAWSLQVAVQIPSLKKFKYCYRPNFRFKDENIKAVMLLAGPMLISTWVQPLYTIVNSRLASSVEGAYSSLEYANQLYLIATGVVSFVVTNLVFPKLSHANAREDKTEAIGLVNMSLKAMMIVIFPLMTGIILLSVPITSIIYEHGEFTEDRVQVVAAALSCYAVGMFGLSVNEVFSKAFFSMKNSRIPMITSIISMLADIVAAYILFKLIGVRGLALAAALGSIINALLNAVCLKRKVKSVFGAADLGTLVKTLFASVCMGAAVYFIYKYTAVYASGMIGNIITAGISAVCGVVIYAALIWILRVKEIRMILKKEG